VKTIVRRQCVGKSRKWDLKGGSLLNLEQSFAQVLKKYRKAASYSQEKLAHLCGLDRTFISLLERGQRRPTLHTIFIISKNLGIKPSELIQEVELIINENNENNNSC